MKGWRRFSFALPYFSQNCKLHSIYGVSSGPLPFVERTASGISQTPEN